MQKAGVRPNEVVYNGVLSALQKSGEYARTMRLFGQMKESGVPLLPGL